VNPSRAIPILSGLAALAAASAAGAARAATPEPSALAFADSRAGVSLDGAWHVIVDPYDNGSVDYRSQPRPHGYFEDARPRDKSDLVEYDFARSPTLQVPGDWNTQRPDLLYYEGTIWYQRRFDAALRPDHRAFVQFGAAAQRATVWLNGKRLGAHEGGFTPFAFEVTDIVRPRDNTIVVKVDNTRRAEALPALNTDWWNYGGLTRSVRLVETPRVFVRAARVQLDRNDASLVPIWSAASSNSSCCTKRTTGRPTAALAPTIASRNSCPSAVWTSACEPRISSRSSGTGRGPATAAPTTRYPPAPSSASVRRSCHSAAVRADSPTERTSRSAFSRSSGRAAWYTARGRSSSHSS